MKKSVFWRQDDSGYKHIRFVISDPDPDNSVMTVNMTTYRSGRYVDTACILTPGEHECIYEKSFILYSHALALDCMKLLQEKFKGTIIQKTDISDGLLSRIQNGAKVSDDLPEEFNKYFSYF